MTRGDHPSQRLICSEEGCSQDAYAISSGRLLCEDCWVGLPLLGLGFRDWLRRILRRGGRGA